MGIKSYESTKVLLEAFGSEHICDNDLARVRTDDKLLQKRCKSGILCPLSQFHLPSSLEIRSFIKKWYNELIRVMSRKGNIEQASYFIYFFLKLSPDTKSTKNERKRTKKR